MKNNYISKKKQREKKNISSWNYREIKQKNESFVYLKNKINIRNPPDIPIIKQLDKEGNP